MTSPLKAVSAFEIYLRQQNQFSSKKNNEKNSKKSDSNANNTRKTVLSNKIKKKPLKRLQNKINVELKKKSKVMHAKPKKISKQISQKPKFAHESFKKTFEKSTNVISELIDHPHVHSNPMKDGETLFQWLINPIDIKTFFRDKWEKSPLHVKRHASRYYKQLMSTTLIDKILRENYILFSKNIDVTSFVNDTRETHNPPGRALPSIVWDYFLNGCSIRMLNPQTYIPKLHALNATLQEFFGCFVGANFYLTPPNSQGFAPHYDDIEAFILQIEGKKRWRVYNPINKGLPRYSSPNFSQSDLEDPILDIVLEEGDMLYFPRGFIHQGDTIGFETHSLHVTLSAYQKNSWGDFLEKLVPSALQNAINKNIEFREGLPINYLHNVGLVPSRSTKENVERQEFIDKTKIFLASLVNYIDIDRAADEMAKNHIHDFLPPVLKEDESICSVYEGGEKMTKPGIIENRVEIEPDTKIRLARFHSTRLLKEEESYRLYFSCENSKEYHEYEPQFLEVEKEFVSAISSIIKSYPRFIRVEDLPIKALDKKIQIVQDLWEKGILISKEPLPIVED